MPGTAVLDLPNIHSRSEPNLVFFEGKALLSLNGKAPTVSSIPPDLPAACGCVLWSFRR